MSRPKTPRQAVPEDQPEAPSKTQRKAAMQALQDLGEQLVALPRDRIAKLPLDETLRSAVAEIGRLSAHEARRRQMQYIGRLMRDADTEAIAEAVAAFAGASRADTARLHRLEDLRDRLLADDAVLAEIGSEHPGADLQRLGQLRRNAIREREQGAAPRSYRALFQLLKEIAEGKPN
ncbi:MAG TPA: ribosome biogenesis factor YjgA [Rhodocyclaceae bacterium]